MLEDFTYATFAPHLGERFRVHLGEGTPTAELELIEVTPLRGRDTAAKVTSTADLNAASFALLFRGARSAQLRQGTFRFEHAELGTFALFITPVAADSAGVQYEAVFNRAVPPSTP